MPAHLCTPSTLAQTVAAAEQAGETPIYIAEVDANAPAPTKRPRLAAASTRLVVVTTRSRPVEQR